MVEFGRDLWMSSGPPPLLKQSHPELVAQNLVQYMKILTYEPAYSSRLFIHLNKNLKKFEAFLRLLSWTKPT